MTSTCLARSCGIFVLALSWIVLSAPTSGAADSDTHEGGGRIALSLVWDDQAGLPTIGYVAAQGPAAQAGVQVGDGLVAIDKIPTTGSSIAQLNRSLEGPVDTVVHLTLRRVGAEDLEATVARRPFLVAYGPAAAAGDPVAQYRHGSFYENSPGADQKLVQAAAWYRKAAEGNYAFAQLKLGELAEGGWGVRQDYKEAAQWYEKAAGQGNAAAQRQLGLCYLHGRGVAQDDQSAFGWFEQSARQDDAVAEECLGYLYREGHGTAWNEQAAFAWYYRSAQQGNATAETNVASAYFEGRGVAQDHHAAFAWFYQAAGQGDARGQWWLASLYDTGKGVKQDRREALYWYEKAVATSPDNERLKHDLMWARLRAFLKDPGSLAAFDPSTLPATTKSWLLKVFCVLAAAYLLGGIALSYATLRAGSAGVKIPTAVGWIVSCWKAKRAPSSVFV